jgi:NAD(P)H-hydrate repair Nnr-like enzyme with NAD(P)H-hydrate dehydratase domain
MATAGSGDVLAGFLGSLLAHHGAVSPVDDDTAARLAACAAHVHGVAGAIAVGSGRPIAAVDIVTALPAAVARVRGWATPDA